MGTFTLVPFGDLPDLRGDLGQRIQAECQSVQSTHLMGQNCYWQLRHQDDARRPFFARALDDAGFVLYTLCFSPEGRLTPNRLLHETSYPVESGDPFSLAKSRYLQMVREKAEMLGLAPLRITATRTGLNAVHDDNPLRVTVTLKELPANAQAFESQLNTLCKVETDLLYHGHNYNAAVKLELEPLPTLASVHTMPEQPHAPVLSPIERGTSHGLQKKTSRNSLHGNGTPPRSPIGRRVSSNLASNGRTISSPKPTPSQPDSPQHTASSVAQEFFKRDLATHIDRSNNASLAVILHDSCYGHRYSRPRTSKASLSSIVERPERILATALGISTAYVLLGGRYAGSKHAPHPECNPDTVPFIIRKSNRFVPLTSPAVTSIHGNGWMSELKIMCDGAETKLAMNGKELVRPEDGDAVKPRLHEGDLYLCAESLDAFEGALGGVLDAVDTVFDVTGPKAAFVGIRPPGHHCSADYPAGFCWLNNVHVGISHAAAVHGLTHAAIIDFDLHHGDGSQSITWAHNARVSTLPKNASFSKRTAIGYFSLHDINSFPCEWGDENKVQAASLCIENAHGQTIWNTHLQPWKTNAEFWELYDKRYSVLIEKARDFFRHQNDRLRSSINAPQPRAMIFISAGFDASEWEGQGMQRHKVNVPTDFYARFTQDIMAMARESDLAVDGRVVSVLEGGYSDRALCSGVMSHLSGMLHDPIRSTNPQALTDRMEGLSIGEHQTPAGLNAKAWSPASLDELDAAAHPITAISPKKPRGPSNPTYSTPTQASNAKVHPTVAARRSSSMAVEPVHKPSVDEVAPGIGWAIAAQEFAKVIIPDRQTRSCRPEDLNAEATRMRRNRQSAITAVPEVTAPSDESKRMQLRGKKSKTPAEDAMSRSSRRTTLGGSELAELIAADGTPRPLTKQRRRVSVASTTLSTTEEAPNPPPVLRRSRRSSTAHSSSASGSKADSAAPKTSRPGSPSKSRARKTPASKGLAKTGAANRINAGDVDDLTSGVKKMSIKLNLPPKPDSEPKKESELKKKTSRAPRKTLATARETKRLVATANASGSSSAAGADKIARTPSSEVPTSPSAMIIARPSGARPISVNSMTNPGFPFSATERVKTPDLLKVGDQPRIADSMGPGPSQLDGSYFESASIDPSLADAPAQPESTAAVPLSTTPESSPQQSVFNKEPVTPEAGRQRLPVFTSTSPIPFAAPQAVNFGMHSDPATFSHGGLINKAMVKQEPQLQVSNIQAPIKHEENGNIRTVSVIPQAPQKEQQ